jgi:hypothetical protein
MSVERATVPCSCCGGTGREPIAPQRQRVIDALDGVDTSTKLNRAANVCAWLLRAGLLRVVERDGKRVVYAATEAAK